MKSFSGPIFIVLPLWLAGTVLTAQPFFHEVSTAAGIDYAGMTYVAAAADFDRDGFPDVAVSRHAIVQLWHNQGDGTFRSFGKFPEADTHGLSWADLDDDGRLDLFISIGAARGFGNGPNQWLRQRSDGSFLLVEDLPEAWADASGRGRCSVPYDFDGDGILDLLVANTFQEGREHRLVSGERSY